MSPLVSILGGVTMGNGALVLVTGNVAGIGLLSAGLAIWILGWR